MKTYINEKGNKVVKLPVSGQEIELRSPKGRDLKQIELMSADTSVGQIGIAMALTVSLAVSKVDQEPLNLEALDDMDAEDFLALSEAVSSFRVFSRA